MDDRLRAASRVACVSDPRLSVSSGMNELRTQFAGVENDGRRSARPMDPAKHPPVAVLLTWLKVWTNPKGSDSARFSHQGCGILTGEPAPVDPRETCADATTGRESGDSCFICK
jgi:hypothetical protein